MIRDLILRIILGTFRQVFGDLLKHGIYVVAVHCRDRNNLRKIIKLTVFLDQREQLLGLYFVNFIED
ncbi:hypothetical protein D3C72_2544700 [compost metagenome]